MRRLAKLRAWSRPPHWGRKTTVALVAFVVALLVAGSVALGGASSGPAAASSDIQGPWPEKVFPANAHNPSARGGVIVGHSYKNDTSRPLRDMRPVPYGRRGGEHEASPNPKTHARTHLDRPDGRAQTSLASPSMPSTTLNFDGIPFPGVSCDCAPPGPALVAGGRVGR